MKTFGLSLILLSGLISSAPISNDVLTVSPDFFPDKLSIYSSEHDIVNLFCPINSLNFDEDNEMETTDASEIHIFFVEADIVDGKYDYKGLYVLKKKQATKLLDNGRDFAATADESKKVYLAATDGIYVYNSKENKAEKYGTITDSIISIAISSSAEYFYILTEDHVLYKVTDEGTQKEVVSDVKDAVQIVLDYENNLFFLDSKNNVHVKKEDGTIKKIKGVPKNPSYAKLVRPPFVLDEGIVFVAGKKTFELSSNGTGKYESIVLNARPTAYSMEAALIQYYAYEKKIYEYNILSIVMGEISLDELTNHLEGKTDEIKAMGSKSRKSFRGH